MRLIATALLVLVASSAWAQEFDWQTEADKYYAAQKDCHVGVDLSEKEVQSACDRRDQLWIELKAHGICFEKGEQEWLPCDALPK